jgi:large subunit ribosomal protein L30
MPGFTEEGQKSLFQISIQHGLPAANPQTVTGNKVMKKIKITLIKSPIDRPERQKLTLKALGLNKTNSSREITATPQVLGMVKKVGHLLKVEEAS